MKNDDRYIKLERRELRLSVIKMLIEHEIIKLASEIKAKSKKR